MAFHMISERRTAAINLQRLEPFLLHGNELAIAVRCINQLQTRANMIINKESELRTQCSDTDPHTHD